LDVFRPPDHDSGLHLPSKFMVQALANLSSYAVRHCRPCFAHHLTAERHVTERQTALSWQGSSVGSRQLLWVSWNQGRETGPGLPTPRLALQLLVVVHTLLLRRQRPAASAVARSRNPVPTAIRPTASRMDEPFFRLPSCCRVHHYNGWSSGRSVVRA